MHFLRIGLIFRRAVATEADAVTEVIAQGSGHDGIEVDDRKPLSRRVVQHDVVEFGIVVRDPQRNLARCDFIDDLSAKIAATLHPVDLAAHFFRSAADIFFHGAQEIFIPNLSVVEIGQNLVELRGVKLRKKICKIAERHGALVKIARIAHALVGRRTFNEDVHTEVIPVLANI